MSTSQLKLLVVGNARHGKDATCEIMQDRWGMKFISSSMFCAENVILAAHPGRWESVEECYEDRVNHRAMWYDLIAAENRPDGATLVRRIYDAGYNIYCGMRNKRELYAGKNLGLFDAIIWVDASDRLPLEDKSSMTIEPWMADYWIDNNGPEEELVFNVDQLMQTLLPHQLPNIDKGSYLP